MRNARLVVAVGLAAGMVSVSMAQQGGRQGGFGGGFGGRGPVMLVQNKAVQEDLKVSEEQVDKLNTWGKEYGTKLRETMKDKFAGLKDLSAEERTTKMATIQAEISKDAYKELDPLLKPEQVTRLHQIERQAAGANAFQDPEVASALKLTDDQKSKVKTAIDEFRKDQREAMTGVFGGGAPDQAKMKEAMAKVQKLQKAAWGQ